MGEDSCMDDLHGNYRWNLAGKTIRVVLPPRPSGGDENVEADLYKLS